jgi:hypothetical protein
VLLDLKIELLRMIAESMALHSVPDLVAECRQRMTDRLTQEDVRFYLRVDRNVLGMDVFTKRTWPTEFHSHTGGLADLLELAYLVQSERQFGVLTRLRELLPDHRQGELWAVVDEHPAESDEEPCLEFDGVRAVLTEHSDARRFHREEYLLGLAALADPSAPVRLTILTSAQDAVTLAPLLEGYAEHLKIRLETGEPLSAPYVPVMSRPFWDRAHRQLWYGQQRVRSFRSYAPGSPHEVVLNTFENDGWPYEIDLASPLESSGGRTCSESEIREQIRNTVRSINNTLQAIEFEADGTRIRWFPLPTAEGERPPTDSPPSVNEPPPQCDSGRSIREILERR